MQLNSKIFKNLLNYRNLIKNLTKLNILNKNKYYLICHLNSFTNLSYKLFNQFNNLKKIFLNNKIYINLMKKNFFFKKKNFFSNQLFCFISIKSIFNLNKIFLLLKNYKLVPFLISPLYILNNTKHLLISLNNINLPIKIATKTILLNLIIKNLKKLIYINFFKFFIIKLS